jgi:hypothetical protein
MSLLPHLSVVAECSRSSFAFVSISSVQVRIFLLPAMPTRVATGKSRLMRAGFHIGTHRKLKVASLKYLLGLQHFVILIHESNV